MYNQQTYPNDKHLILKLLCTKYSKGLVRLRTKKYVYFTDINNQIVPVAAAKARVGGAIIIYNQNFRARFGSGVAFGNFFSCVENKRKFSLVRNFFNMKL